MPSSSAAGRARRGRLPCAEGGDGRLDDAAHAAVRAERNVAVVRHGDGAPVAVWAARLGA